MNKPDVAAGYGRLSDLNAFIVWEFSNISKSNFDQFCVKTEEYR